jgi:hypothetical protein
MRKAFEWNTTAGYTFSFHVIPCSESKPVFGIEMRAIFLSCYMKPFLITGCQCLFITARSITEVKIRSGLETRNYGRRGSVALTTRHPFIRTSWH